MLSAVTDTLFTRTCQSLTLDWCAHSSSCLGVKPPDLLTQLNATGTLSSVPLGAKFGMARRGCETGCAHILRRLPVCAGSAAVVGVELVSEWFSKLCASSHDWYLGFSFYVTKTPTHWIATPILSLSLHGTNPRWDGDLNYFAQILGGGNAWWRKSLIWRFWGACILLPLVAVLFCILTHNALLLYSLHPCKQYCLGLTILASGRLCPSFDCLLLVNRDMEALSRPCVLLARLLHRLFGSFVRFLCRLFVFLLLHQRYISAMFHRVALVQRRLTNTSSHILGCAFAMLTRFFCGWEVWWSLMETHLFVSNSVFCVQQCCVICSHGFFQESFVLDFCSIHMMKVNFILLPLSSLFHHFWLKRLWLLYCVVLVPWLKSFIFELLIRLHQHTPALQPCHTVWCTVPLQYVLKSENKMSPGLSFLEMILLSRCFCLNVRVFFSYFCKR